MYKTVKVFWGIFVAAAVLAGAAPFVWAGKDTVIPGVRLNGTAAVSYTHLTLPTIA